MQTTSNSAPLSACASCKHQRKKCTEKCTLAPYFPVERTHEFQAVHKVFGVSNITKIVKNLKQEDRKRAVDSLIWEALCRQREPVLGPYGEYRRVCEELRIYRNQGRVVFHNNNAVPSNINSSGGRINNTPGNVNSNNNSFSNNNMNSLLGFCSYGYSPNHIQDSHHHHHEIDDGGANVILPHQHHHQQYLSSNNGFNQQFFLTAGQYNQMDGSKSVDSTLWEELNVNQDNETFNFNIVSQTDSV